MVRQIASPCDLFEEALARHEGGELSEAGKLYQAVLRQDPNHFGALHYLGTLRAQQGRLNEAITLLGLALAGEPECAEAQNHAGSVLHMLKRYREAIGCFEKALALDSDYAEAHYNKGAALQALARNQEAIVSYEAALAIEPTFAPARLSIGTALQALHRHDEAVEQFKTAVALAPDYSRAHAALGMALQALGHDSEAIAHYESALAIAPDDADTHNNFGLALQACNRNRDAVEHYEKALSLRPGSSAVHNNLGMALQALNRHDEAILHYQSAIAGSPRHASRYANLGLALQEVGRLDEACQAFSKAIAIAPGSGRFYRNLAICKRFVAADPELAGMEALADGRASLPEDERRQLLFALGKAFADLGQYDRSFAYLREGNALKRRPLEHEEARLFEQFTRIRSVFSRELLADLRGCGHPSSRPIFILGMPRSGTTLVEQILASNSQVFGAGELVDFETQIAHIAKPDGAPASFPEEIPHVSRGEFFRLGARYLDRVAAIDATAVRITDKMPLNFLSIGLIQLALPNAFIIHTIRDPIDTCFSCFSTLFAGEHRIAYGLLEIGRYYRAYQDLMEHWRSVLPSNAMLEVRYEDIIADLDREARRIVEHCGLEWEDDCLRFYDSRHPVRTASAAQVRHPIYQSSVGRWFPYRDFLRPLLDALCVDPTDGTDTA